MIHCLLAFTAIHSAHGESCSWFVLHSWWQLTSPLWLMFSSTAWTSTCIITVSGSWLILANKGYLSYSQRLVRAIIHLHHSCCMTLMWSSNAMHVPASISLMLWLDFILHLQCTWILILDALKPGQSLVALLWLWFVQCQHLRLEYSCRMTVIYLLWFQRLTDLVTLTDDEEWGLHYIILAPQMRSALSAWIIFHDTVMFIFNYFEGLDLLLLCLAENSIQLIYRLSHSPMTQPNLISILLGL